MMPLMHMLLSLFVLTRPAVIVPRAASKGDAQDEMGWDGMGTQARKLQDDADLKLLGPITDSKLALVGS